MSAAEELAPAPTDASRLCLACGICCQGLLHDTVVLLPDEEPLAQRLGLAVVPGTAYPLFSLPCPCHREGQCAVYAERPTTCRTYQCKLLECHLAGEISLERALRLVEQVKHLVGRLERRLERAVPVAGFWQRLRRFLDDETAGDIQTISEMLGGSEALLDVTSLRVLIRQEFKDRTTPEEAKL